jgi:hypothetical protein
MKVKDYLQFAMHEYNNGTSPHYKLGDIVFREADSFYNKDSKIGVIIQVHDEFEYRTDMFGNCHHSEISLATREQINEFRPQLFPHIANDPIEEIWERLGNVPINDDEEIEEDFEYNGWVFDKGTDREEIWHMIEEDYGVKVYNLMFPNS